MLLVDTALFSSLPRALLSVRGKDRVSFLHQVLTHDIKGLQTGQGRAACLLDRQGKILFSAIAHALADEILLEMDPLFLPTAFAALERYRISEQVEFSPTPADPLLALQGPRAEEMLRQSWPAAPLPAALFALTAPSPERDPPWISRWDPLGLPGYWLWTDPAKAESVASRLLGLGAVSASLDRFHELRIQAGTPWAGKEIREGLILNELGDQGMVSFTKGCYVGQEIVARIKYRAHPPRLLTGFILEVPTPEGSALYQGEERVGTLTSVCESSALGKPIALGFLKHGIPPGPLQISASAGAGTATPTPLPFP